MPHPHMAMSHQHMMMHSNDDTDSMRSHHQAMLMHRQLMHRHDNDPFRRHILRHRIQSQMMGGSSDDDHPGNPHSERTMGYNEEWVADGQDVGDEMTCTICTGIMRTPTIVEACGHSFCRGCLHRVRPRACPLCRASAHGVRRDPALEAKIDALTAKCPKCPFSGSLKEVHAHEAGCDVDTRRAMQSLRAALPSDATREVTPEMRAAAVRVLASTDFVHWFAGFLGHAAADTLPPSPHPGTV